MNRYRDPTNPPKDDNSLQEGDVSLIGVNSYDSAENLQPGQCQAAVNMDFTTQNAATRGGFVCLPELGTAPFGSAWNTETAAAANTWTSVTYGNGLYVAVSSDGVGNRVMTSPDGITWTSRVSAVDNDWTGVCYAAGVFVAVSQTGVGNRVMTSPDGITWTSRVSAADRTWRAVTYGAGVFVAVAEDAALDVVMTSPDGITWTSRNAASANGSFEAICYGNGLFLAVGSSRFMTSPDGITWTNRLNTGAFAYTSVAFGNGLYIALASTISSATAISSDAISWTVSDAGALGQNGLIFGNGVFLGVRNASGYSADGVNIFSLSGAGALNAVTWGTSGFVAVGVNRVRWLPTTAVYASRVYSDPNDAGSQWVMMVGYHQLGFYSFGQASRSVAYGVGLTVTEQSTAVQANNAVYIFRGSDVTPLYWDGNWGSTVTLAPTPTPPGPGFQIIPNSNQATYYQNRLWVIQGKDDVAASDVLDFTTYDLLANDFNLNTGDSDFLVTTYPFGTTTLVVFKNKSIIALTSVDGALTDVVATEITRQVGCIGINAVVSVGSDLVYMSDRNINLLSLTATSNALQHQTVPLSTNIRTIMRRVNWQVASKVSMAYWDNKLFVSLPLDNATSCNTIVVYNFVTQQWYGEWSAALGVNLMIQGFVTANYFGEVRLYVVTEDGRMLVTGEDAQDLSGARVGASGNTFTSEIATSIVTRAYAMDNDNRFTRRLYVDLSTNRPEYSITAYVDGANEFTKEVTDQTYSRASSWIFSDSTYDLTNANDDYNRAFRKDYSTGPGNDDTDGIQCQSGFLPEMRQDFRLPVITRRNGRLQWMKITNSQGYIGINSVGFEARAGYRSSLIQVG